MADQLLVSVEEARVRVELCGNCVLLDLDVAREFEQRFLAALLSAELAASAESPRRIQRGDGRAEQFAQAMEGVGPHDLTGDQPSGLQLGWTRR